MVIKAYGRVQGCSRSAELLKGMVYADAGGYEACGRVETWVFYFSMPLLHPSLIFFYLAGDLPKMV